VGAQVRTISLEEEDQEKWLQAASAQVKQQAFMMRRALVGWAASGASSPRSALLSHTGDFGALSQ